MKREILSQWNQVLRKFPGLTAPFDAPAAAAWSPNTDMFEDESELVVRIELGGVTPDQVRLRLQEQILRVEGERPSPRGGDAPGRPRCRQLEIEYGPFRRDVILPWPADAERAHARLQNGMLEIRLPRRSAARAAAVTVQIET